MIKWNYHQSEIWDITLHPASSLPGDCSQNLIWWHRWILCQKNLFFPSWRKKLWKTFPIFFTFRSGKFFNIALFWQKIVKISIFWGKIAKIREGFNKKKPKKYMNISILGSDPPNMEKTKKDMLFFGLLSSFRTKNIFKIFFT